MGVLVSEKPDPLLHDSKSVKIATFSRTDTFLVKAKLNIGNEDFYYRSYAINGEGRPMGHPKKYPWETVAGVINCGMGRCFPTAQENNGCTVHGLAVSMLQVIIKHGFFMLFWLDLCSRGGTGGIWLWLEENGWVWTSKRIFPGVCISFKKMDLLLSEELVENTLDGDFTGNTNAQDEISKFTNLDAEYLEDGWWASPWFGNFHYNEISKQVTHEEFGKISIIPGGEE